MWNDNLEKQKKAFFDSLYDNLSENDRKKVDEKVAVEYAKMNRVSIYEAREIISKYNS